MILPIIIPWRDLKPGMLAWDAGDSDLVTGRFSPLLLVGEDGVGRWLFPNGGDAGLHPIDLADPLGRAGAACPWAVLLARDVSADPDLIVAAVAAVAEPARELVLGAEQDAVAQGEERLFWPFQAAMMVTIGTESAIKVYRWRIEPGASGPRVVAEHKLMDAPIERWAAVRNPDTLARLREYTPEGK